MAEAMIFLLIYLVLCTPLGLMVAAAGLQLLPFILVIILTIVVISTIAKIKPKQEKEGKKERKKLINKIILITLESYIIYGTIFIIGWLIFWCLNLY